MTTVKATCFLGSFLSRKSNYVVKTECLAVFRIATLLVFSVTIVQNQQITS